MDGIMLDVIVYETAHVRKGDKDIIKLLERNDMSITEFIRKNQEHIENLEEQIQQVELIRENVHVQIEDMRTEVFKSLATDAITLEDIKKATDGNQ